RVYSTRFVSLIGSAGPSSYVVPQGKVAVIRSIDATNPTAAAVFASVLIAGVGYVASGLLPAYPSSGFHWDGRQVARQGETIQVQGSGAMHAMVSGYLFDDL